MVALPLPPVTAVIGPYRLVALAAMIGLAGCAASADYPSLAKRSIEGVSLAEPAPKPPAPATPPAVAAQRYAPLVARAQDGDAAFEREVRAARAVLDRGRRAPTGSDAWSAAQQAYSRLGSYRGPVGAAAAALQAASEAPEAHDDAGLAAAAAEAIATVQAIEAREAAAMQALAPPAP